MNEHKHIWGKPFRSFILFGSKYSSCKVKGCNKILHIKDGHIFDNNFKNAYNSGKNKK